MMMNEIKKERPKFYNRTDPIHYRMEMEDYADKLESLLEDLSNWLKEENRKLNSSLGYAENENDQLKQEREEMYLNMQYYMEYCQNNEYATPQEWIEKHKHFLTKPKENGN